MRSRLTWLLCCALACAPGGGPQRSGDVAGESQVLRPALAATEPPPAPVRSPADSMATFRVAPGFRVELVAAEPLVEDPVAIAFDPAGRLWAIEMRGYMPDLRGSGDDAPVGRVVVLEDDDADGRMDRSTVFMDGLVLPRAIALAGDGVLVGEPPHLWHCADLDGDLRCDRKQQVGSYGDPLVNPEHQENGLARGLDGWLYSAKSDRRLRWRDGQIEIEPTLFRGQWGIAIDDAGRLLYNTNFTYLIADFFPAEYLLRHPATAPPLGVAEGVGEVLVPEPVIHTIRLNLGVTRGYREGELRDDGRLARPTAVSGVAVQRAAQYGPEFAGDLFLPDPAANCVVQMKLRERGIELVPEHVTYPDPDWGEREFLCATDERFRPVSAALGPDGTIHVVDMYRGVIQDAEFVTTYLAAHVNKLGLEEPLGLGRIYRIVREDRPLRRESPGLDRATDLERVAALSAGNGWTRDTAQRLLSESPDLDPAALSALRALGHHTPTGRVHALWTLHARGEIDLELVRAAARDDVPRVRAAGLRVGEVLAGGADARGWVDLLVEALGDGQPSVRLQAAFSLGEATPDPAARAPLLGLIDRRGGEPYVLQAVLSGLAGQGLEALRDLLSDPGWSAETPARSEALGAFASGALDRLRGLGGGAADPGALVELLDLIAAQPAQGERAWRRRALLGGLAAAASRAGFSPVPLLQPHSLFDAQTGAGEAERAAKVAFTWPGDPDRPGSIQLSEAEQARAARGGPLYAQICSSCHLAHGRGQTGLAPSLVGSLWVLDSDGWLLRIALQGIAGPLVIEDRRWDTVMPGHGAHPRLDDEGMAALLTWVRRAWGHEGRPISPAQVAEVRARTASRDVPWTAEELYDLEVDHRYDIYIGRYRASVVPISLHVSREGPSLVMSNLLMGSARLSPAEDGVWRSEGRSETFRFARNAAGQVTGLEIRAGSETIALSKVE